MAKVCERCKRSMSSHDARSVGWQLVNVTWIFSTPVISVKDGHPNSGESSVRSLIDARARANQRGRQHWSAAFHRLEAWILSRPVSAPSSGPASEISSLAGGDVSDDNLLSVCQAP